VIFLRVPAVLHYRDLVLRAVAVACKVAAQWGPDSHANQEVAPLGDEARSSDTTFLHELSSAVGEAFNNIAIHGYAGEHRGEVTIEIHVDARAVTVELRDDGASFDIDAVPTPQLAELPESGMGLFIVRSFVDELRYLPGRPNVLRLEKRFTLPA
jgi:serine/threonine-protein kinase RsbW